MDFADPPDGERMTKAQMTQHIEELRAKGAELEAMLKDLERKLKSSTESADEARANAARTLFDLGNSQAEP